MSSNPFFPSQPTPGSGSLSCLALVCVCLFALLLLFFFPAFSRAFLSAFNPPSPLFLTFPLYDVCLSVARHAPPLSAAHNPAAACRSIRCNGCESCTSPGPRLAFLAGPSENRCIPALRLDALLCFTTRKDSERPILGTALLFSLLFSLLLCDGGCSVFPSVSSFELIDSFRERQNPFFGFFFGTLD